jgi:hypothetical protein
VKNRFVSVGLTRLFVRAYVGYAGTLREYHPRWGFENANACDNLRWFRFPPVMPETQPSLPLNLHRLVTYQTGGEMRVLSVLKTLSKDKTIFEVVLNENDKRLNGKKFSIKSKFLDHYDNVSVYVGRHKISPDGIAAFLRAKGADEKVIGFAKDNAIKTLWAFKNAKRVKFDHTESLVEAALTGICENVIQYFNSRAVKSGIQFWANQKSMEMNGGNPSWMDPSKQVFHSPIPRKSDVAAAPREEFRVDECTVCLRNAKVTMRNSHWICVACDIEKLKICQRCEEPQKASGFDVAGGMEVCEHCVCEVE